MAWSLGLLNHDRNEQLNNATRYICKYMYIIIIISKQRQIEELIVLIKNYCLRYIIGMLMTINVINV